MVLLRYKSFFAGKHEPVEIYQLDKNRYTDT